MITWIQIVLQKHYKWLLFALLGVVIIAFVFTYGASGGFGPRNRNQKLEFYGFDLFNEKIRKRIFDGANLSLYLNTGRVVNNEQELEHMGLVRATFLYLADRADLPEPLAEDLMAFIQKLPLFYNENNEFDAQKYTVFQSSMSRTPQFGEAFARQVIVDDYRIDKMEQALKGPSLLKAGDVQKQAELLYTDWKIAIGKLNYEDFDPHVDLDESKLESFYNESQANYVHPEKKVFSYLIFEGEGMEAKANEFVYKLYAENISYKSEKFKAVLEESKLSLKKLKPFDLNNIKDTQLSPIVLKEGINLDLENYYSSPVVSDGKVYVLLFEKAIPKALQPFKKVLAQVKKDYREQLKRELFIAEAENLKQSLNRVANLGEFKQVVKSLKLEYLEPLSFKITQAPGNVSLDILNKLEGLEYNKVSDPILADQFICFIYLVDKNTPSIHTDSPEYAVTYQNLSTFEQFSKVQNIIGGMLEKEINRINNGL